MKGQILNFSIQENKGVITSEDGKRYSFEGREWKENVPPNRGQAVDFDIDANSGLAVSIYKALSSAGSGVSLGSGKQKNKITAGLLALFLGGLGVHKFYLGAILPGLVYLIVYLLSVIAVAATDNGAFLLICFVLGIFCLIDAVLYFTKSDEDFQRIYVEEKRQWF